MTAEQMEQQRQQMEQMQREQQQKQQAEAHQRWMEQQQRIRAQQEQPALTNETAAPLAIQQQDPSDPYGVLGVSRDTDAATIKKRYQELAMQHHPDKNPGDETAAATFQNITEAYRKISPAPAQATIPEPTPTPQASTLDQKGDNMRTSKASWYNPMAYLPSWMGGS
jgi:DnaJ-domain-containing protein 1